MKKLFILATLMFGITVNAADHFKTGSPVPTQALITEIQAIYDKQISGKDVKNIKIEGHTDQRGGVVYNLKLSVGRAQAAEALLIKMGTKPELIKSVVGKGKSELLTLETTPVGYSKNRRVVIVVDSIVNVISECPPAPAPVIVEKEKIVEKKVEVKAEPKRNRISLMAGNGPRDGLNRSNSPTLVEVESRVGAMAGVQYQRLLPVLNDRLSIGGQALTNKTFMLELGLDF
jgi:hypothetical protein